MKTALVTLVLATVFFGAGLGITRMLRPHDGPAAEDVAAGDHAGETHAEAPDARKGEGIGEVQGEVQQITMRLAAAESRADSLRRLLDEHEATYQESQGDAAAMASTLSRLEDAQLKNIVQRLDGRSFVKLYEAASSRNQSRLLDALTPDQAALVHPASAARRRLARDAVARRAAARPTAPARRYLAPGAPRLVRRSRAPARPAAAPQPGPPRPSATPQPAGSARLAPDGRPTPEL